MLAHPEIEVPSNLQTLVYWINDGGVDECRLADGRTGIDWQASYDWEWGDLGAFNAGITGTYYLSQESQVPGGIIADFYHTTLAALNGVEQVGVESRPRFKYRARLGWSDGTWSVTGFMDYEQHFFHTQSAPPNVNFACITPGGTIGGLPDYTNPCWVTDYTNFQPSYYTFDLSLGYSTGDRPANEYLRNISVQLVVQNIMDKDRTLPVSDHHRWRRSVRLRHHQEPVRPRHLDQTAEGVLTGWLRVGEQESLFAVGLPTRRTQKKGCDPFRVAALSSDRTIARCEAFPARLFPSPSTTPWSRSVKSDARHYS